MKKYIFKYDMFFINILSFIILFLISFITYYLVIRFNICGLKELNLDNIGILSFIMIIFYMMLHELIHGLFYIINGANRNDVKYGIALEKGILFTKCSQDINKKNILISVIAPFIILGIITFILSIIFNLPYLLFLSIINISGCSGDLVVFFFFLRRKNDITFREFNDTTTFGITTSEKLDDRKFIGIKLDKVVDEFPLDEKFIAKVNISKESKWILIIFLVLSILLFIYL